MNMSFRRTEKVSADFSHKTKALLDFINDTYVMGEDEESERLMAKLKGSEVGMGFDTIFKPTDDKK